jgi:heme/copper-type cytochrome/quinol oxidase subunit 2
MYNSNLITPNTTTTTPDVEAIFGGMAAGAIILVAILGLIALAIVVFFIIAECKLYAKAGEKWWKVFIPIYNSWIETKITGLAWWWLPIFLLASSLYGANDLAYVGGFGLILVSFNYNYNLAKKFGKSNGFAVLCTLLPIIGIPILAFGSAKYDKDAAVDKNGIFAITKDSLVK